MIRFTFILSAMFLALNVSYAQSTNLQGPAAKNYKPWKQSPVEKVVMINVAETPQKGPAFKNSRPWSRDVEQVQVSNAWVAREKVTGPKAKNRKPWRNSQ